MVRLLVPVPVPDLEYFNRAVPDTRIFSSGSTELTKVSGKGMEVVPSLPKCRVRVIQGVCTPCHFGPYLTKHSLVRLNVCSNTVLQTVEPFHYNGRRMHY